MFSRPYDFHETERKIITLTAVAYMVLEYQWVVQNGLVKQI
jgi:hypothetical protein